MYSSLEFFFFIEHRLLEAVISTNIGIMTFSDHAPVNLQMKIGEVQKRSNIWRLNEELLHDKELEKQIKEELDLYLRLNKSLDISEATLWETHKAYIRGILIMAGSEKKK